MRTTEEIAAAVKELLAGGRLTYSQLAERYRSDLPCSLRTAKTHLEILREEIDRCGGSWYGIDRVPSWTLRDLQPNRRPGPQDLPADRCGRRELALNDSGASRKSR